MSSMEYFLVPFDVILTDCNARNHNEDNAGINASYLNFADPTNAQGISFFNINFFLLPFVGHSDAVNTLQERLLHSTVDDWFYKKICFPCDARFHILDFIYILRVFEKVLQFFPTNGVNLQDIDLFLTQAANGSYRDALFSSMFNGSIPTIKTKVAYYAWLLDDIGFAVFKYLSSDFGSLTDQVYINCFTDIISIIKVSSHDDEDAVQRISSILDSYNIDFDDLRCKRIIKCPTVGIVPFLVKFLSNIHLVKGFSVSSDVLMDMFYIYVNHCSAKGETWMALLDPDSYARIGDISQSGCLEGLSFFETPTFSVLRGNEEQSAERRVTASVFGSLGFASITPILCSKGPAEGNGNSYLSLLINFDVLVPYIPICFSDISNRFSVYSTAGVLSAPHPDPFVLYDSDSDNEIDSPATPAADQSMDYGNYAGDDSPFQVSDPETSTERKAADRHTETGKDNALLPFLPYICAASIAQKSLPRPLQSCVNCKEALCCIYCAECPSLYLCSECDTKIHDLFPFHMSRIVLPSKLDRHFFQTESLKDDTLRSTALISPRILRALQKVNVSSIGEIGETRSIVSCFRACLLDQPCTRCGYFSGFTSSPIQNQSAANSTIKFVLPNGVVTLCRANFQCTDCHFITSQDPKTMVTQTVYPSSFFPCNISGSVLVHKTCLYLRQNMITANPSIATSAFANAFSFLNSAEDAVITASVCCPPP